ncbi:MAG: HAMP domain-containing protein, partial [Planctomycetota bacterium]|nr:HAMP domain-containing protein [Planctomycetota bacterium]
MALRPSSVRMRLTLWYLFACSMVLGGYSLGCYFYLRHNLYKELDAAVHADFERVEHSFPGKAYEHEEPGWTHVWALGGNLLRGDPALAGAAPPHEPHAGTKEWDGIGSVRVFSKVTSTYGDPPARVLIRVARPEGALRADLARFAWILGTGFVVAVALAGLIGYGLARHALAPMDRMAERARTITAERLDERLPVENPDDELGRLASVFNGTFARLERSFEELRRFTADASHELRTPLAAMRSVGEVGLRENSTAAAYKEVVKSMLEEVDRLTLLT